MRLFIALELPPHIVAEMERAQQRLRRGRSHPVRWVAPEAFHLTVQFLGEVEEQHVPDILAALQRISWRTTDTDTKQAGTIRLPRLRLAQVGAFPNLQHPRTLWMGMEGDVDGLTHVYEAVTAATEPLGFVPEQKKFRPHLTLGRVRNEATPAQVSMLADALIGIPPPEPLSWQCKPPLLFHSTLTPRGPIYRKVRS